MKRLWISLALIAGSFMFCMVYITVLQHQNADDQKPHDPVEYATELMAE